MKKLVLFIPVIIVLILSSCDGRKSKIDRLNDAVSEFNNREILIDLKDYYPEGYTETKTDSIISKTFRVSVKNYTVMDKKILLNETVKNLHKTSQFHRVFESDIVVSVEDKIIYDRHISVEKFKDFETSDFWNNATLEHVWVNQETSNNLTLSLGVSILNPKNKAFKLYEILIDKLGNERLTLIEDHS
ncbi:hypothetical protein [Psychroserpens damuponensis]|uniref:hypothetical protein n=1 Tax=Psychroserpens damuponensis TaxID=943936 RepID=UPI000B204F02|nr:hypothetical protein [Psychroserpens damuponensis]